MKRTLGILIAAMAISLFLFLPAFSQEDMKTLAPEALQPLKRMPAVFNHDAHNEKAKLDDCAVCHHNAENGKIVEGDSVGTPCADCHDGKTNSMALRRAYHVMCTSCHIERGAGPVTCNGCHTTPPAE